MRFEFASKPPATGQASEPQRVPVEMDGQGRGEANVTVEPKRVTVIAVVESDKPRAEVLGSVWVVQEAGAKP